MCGIAAVFDSDGVDVGELRAMTDLIRHRGPDSEGFVLLGPQGAAPFPGPDTDPSCLALDSVDSPRAEPGSGDWTAGLGHRRLSIVDLSPTGHQPMASPDGRVWLTYNGEIYNFVELREELRRGGQAFRGTSDTEVLLHGYLAWGEDVLPRLRGMFAFVIVDLRRGIGFAARDRFGIKPLYFRSSPGRLTLGSEVKQLLDPMANRINGPRLYDFLNLNIHDHTAETMFADVQQVPGGTCMRWSLAAPDRPETRRWWSLRPRPFDGTRAAAAAEFRRLLADSVAEHLRADVPVGSCLSGGLDSSAVVCLTRDLLDESSTGTLQRTFTATSSDDRLDETRWAALVVDRVGAEPHTVQPDMTQIGALLPRLAWHMDEPFGSTSILAQWKVFELAHAADTKVLLDGQGADEQLAGYSVYFGLRLAELTRRGRLRQLRREVAAIGRTHPGALRHALLTVGYLMVPPAVGRPVGRRLAAPGQDPDAWISRENLGVSGYPDALSAAGARIPDVRAFGRAQLTTTNLPMLLRYEDRDSMAHSVEARVPFLDHRLVEFTTGLPSDYLISDGTTKRVLRDALRGVIPDPIRERVDKIGFATAEEAWLRAHPRDVRHLLSDAVDSLGGALTPGVLTRLDEVLAGARPFDYWIWRCISAGAWADTFGARA